jgi:hypothetical protein
MGENRGAYSSQQATVMNEDNQHIPANQTVSHWWVAGLLTPYVGLFLGWILNMASRHGPTFWIDGEAIGRWSCALIPPILLGLSFTIASFSKRERNAGWTLIGWLGLIIILSTLMRG